MHEGANCIECGAELPAERAELGYAYCTRDACQAVHHRGLTVTTVGVNKSADSVVVADAAEVRRRGEAGEFGRKDTGLGLGYRGIGGGGERASGAGGTGGWASPPAAGAGGASAPPAGRPSRPPLPHDTGGPGSRR